MYLYDQVVTNNKEKCFVFLGITGYVISRTKISSHMVRVTVREKTQNANNKMLKHRFPFFLHDFLQFISSKLFIMHYGLLAYAKTVTEVENFLGVKFNIKLIKNIQKITYAQNIFVALLFIYFRIAVFYI